MKAVIEQAWEDMSGSERSAERTELEPDMAIALRPLLREVEAKVERVERLHRKITTRWGDVCEACSRFDKVGGGIHATWPCATARALDEES